mgnify:CR=1 FL=1
MVYSFFFFQAEDGIRDLVRSRGLGDVYKRQVQELSMDHPGLRHVTPLHERLDQLGLDLHDAGVALSLIHI